MTHGDTMCLGFPSCPYLPEKLRIRSCVTEALSAAIRLDQDGRKKC
jgi:hypothetical protein